jgi:hypothetical protein
MCGHTSIILQGFPRGMSFFHRLPLQYTRHNISCPCVHCALNSCSLLRHGGDENDCVRMVNSGSHFPRPLCAPKARVTVL